MTGTKSSLFAAALLAVAAGHAGELAQGESFARWNGNGIAVGNGRFTAAFRMCAGILQPVSFKANGVELLRGCEMEGDGIEVREAKGGWSVVGERELAVCVSSGGRTAVIRVWRSAGGPMVEETPAAPLPDAPGAKDWGSKSAGTPRADRW